MFRPIVTSSIGGTITTALGRVSGCDDSTILANLLERCDRQKLRGTTCRDTTTSRSYLPDNHVISCNCQVARHVEFVAATDGLFKYAARETISATVRTGDVDDAAQNLIDGWRASPFRRPP